MVNALMHDYCSNEINNKIILETWCHSASYAICDQTSRQHFDVRYNHTNNSKSQIIALN